MCNIIYIVKLKASIRDLGVIVYTCRKKIPVYKFILVQNLPVLEISLELSDLGDMQ